MSKYTTQVRFICEQACGIDKSTGYSSIEGVIDSAVSKVFDFEFPIFDVYYKPILCKKILRHYYTREIGLETVGLWKHFLCTRLNEIMPYYNKLYESEKIKINPLEQVSMSTRYIKDNIGASDVAKNSDDKGNSSVTVKGDANDSQLNWDLYSDTPQGAIDNLDSETYLTNARKNRTTNNANRNESTATNSELNRTEKQATNMASTEEYIQEIVGLNGSVSSSKLLKEYRDTFINIDMMIINELSDLFMNLW